MDDITRKRKEPPFKSQKRALNIVYFLDAKKTRSIKLPMHVVKALAAVGVLAVTWAIGSMFLVGSLGGKVSLLKEQLVETNQVVFDYQARFDGAYESAYPRDKSELYKLINGSGDNVANNDFDAGELGETNTNPNTNPNSDGPKESSTGVVMSARDVRDAEAIKREKLENPDLPTSQPQDEDKVAKTYDVFPTLKVKRARVKPGRNSTEFSILLKNNSDIKVSGYVWAVAAISGANGDMRYIPAPSRISIDNNGEVKNPKSSKRFALRNFSSKKFTFPINAEEVASLSHIKVGLVDQDGHTRKVKIPIKK